MNDTKGLPLRFGIVGMGAISSAHVRAIEGLAGCAELVAVADIRFEEPEGALEARDMPWDTYASLDAMLELANIDVVTVCTPPNVHADLAVAALEAGKHVIIEKPADVGVEPTDRIISAAKATGRKATVISQHRFDPSSLAVHQAIKSGRFGRLTRAAAQVRWWRNQDYFDVVPWRGSQAVSGGGALISQSIHTVDLMLWTMGPVDEVFAYQGILAHERIEVEDSLVAAVKFRSGALGVIEANIASYPGMSARLEISGDRGSAIIDGDRLEYFHAAKPGEQTGMYGASGETNQAEVELRAFGGATSTGGNQAPSNLSSAHQEQIRDFIDAVHDDREPTVPLEDARYVLQVIEAIHESARIGKPVALA